MTHTSPIRDVREVELFREGGSQILRIPVEFEFADSRVIIRQEGDKLVVEPQRKKPDLIEILRAMSPLDPEDDFPDDVDEKYPTKPPPRSS